MRLVLVLVLFFTAILVCFEPVQSQTLTSRPHLGVEQVPLGEEIYPFLRHLSIRGMIDGYSEAQLPLSEYEIVQFLDAVDPTKLSAAEQELLKKFLRTYAHEPREAVTWFSADSAKPLFFSGIFTDHDKYIYRWFDDSTHSDLFVHAVGSLEARHKTEPTSASVVLANAGGRISGTLSGHVGYFMQTTNGERFGNSDLALEDPLLSTNHNFLYFSDHQFFDFTTAEFSYNYDWFTGKIAREALSIGGGYQNDNVIVSPNVPTYDFISLGAHVHSVRYLAMLASLVPDTVADNITGPGLPVKYMALHDVTFLLGRDVELGFTDNLIFGQRLELGYLNPFSFLKVVEHGVQDLDKDNAQMSLHARWRMGSGFETRGQMLMDDVVFGNIGKGWWGNKFAWQFGGMWAGAFGQPNLDLEAEWIHVEPYTYTHWNTDDARYTTSGSLLGAQIGPNAQSVWSMLRWAPSAKLTVMLEGQFVERGENVYDSSGRLIYNAGGDYTLSFTDQSSAHDTHFLDGRRVNIFTVTANLEFEPWRGLVVFARGTKRSVDYLEDIPRTPGVDLSGVVISHAPHEFPETVVAVGARVLF